MLVKPISRWLVFVGWGTASSGACAVHVGWPPAHHLRRGRASWALDKLGVRGVGGIPPPGAVPQGVPPRDLPTWRAAHLQQRICRSEGTRLDQSPALTGACHRRLRHCHIDSCHFLSFQVGRCRHVACLVRCAGGVTPLSCALHSPMSQGCGHDLWCRGSCPVSFRATFT